MITGQILYGSLVLGLCSIMHVAIVSLTIGLLAKMTTAFEASMPGLRRMVVLSVAFVGVLASHTVQVWFWAFCLVFMGALGNMEQALYFSLVTYTTVGYGDVTLDESYHIFGAMAAVTGLLNFGLSTAFLVGAFGRFVPIRDNS